jgi:hypothetical protein
MHSSWSNGGAAGSEPGECTEETHTVELLVVRIAPGVSVGFGRSTRGSLRRAEAHTGSLGGNGDGSEGRRRDPLSLLLPRGGMRPRNGLSP